MEPVSRKLNDEDRAVLIVLMQEGRPFHDRGQGVGRRRLERKGIDVDAVLARLERYGLVSREADPSGAERWHATLELGRDR